MECYLVLKKKDTSLQNTERLRGNLNAHHQEKSHGMLPRMRFLKKQDQGETGVDK